MRLLLHPSDQPVFRLSVRMASCRLELRVNDVPVFRDDSGEAAAFDMPINEWLFQGRNDIDIQIAPLQPGSGFGKSALVHIVLQHKAARDAHKNMHDAGVLDWQPAATAHHHHGDEDPLLPEDEDAPLLALPGQDDEVNWRQYPVRRMKDGAIHISTSLALPPPWPVCPWERSLPLTVDQRYVFAVQQVMLTFAESIRMGGWQRFVGHRRAALAAAYYLTENDADEALSIQRLVQERWHQPTFPTQGLKLELAGNRRLARLVLEQTGESPLTLINEKDGVVATIEAWWMFNQNWVMIR